jgi:predicted nucleic-acid-binding Zn-ribbon protein
MGKCSLSGYVSDINWPKQLCPHCGNRDDFRYEVVMPVDYDGPASALDFRHEEMTLPFNSRVWCLKCGKQGRWNAWQRGAYPAEPKTRAGKILTDLADGPMED